MSIKPEDILPDTEDFVELNGTIVRKGSIAAFLKNIDLLEDPNNTEKDEALKMLKQLAPAIIASGLHRHVVFKNQTVKDILLQNHTYLGLCTEVYELSKPNVPKDAYDFYLGYAQRANGPILEPMCGTGRFLIPFLEKGFDIHGFDASKHMLDRLYAKTNTANVWHGLAQNLNKSEKYNLIFIPSGSFCLITNIDEAKLVLQKFYQHLNHGGIFLFEAETVIPTLDMWRGSIWSKANGQKILLNQLTVMQDDICNSICKYELIEAGHVIQTEIEELKVRIYQQDQLLEILKYAGFKDIRSFKAFDHSKSPSNEDASIVYECRK